MVALVGAITLLLAGFSALTQRDIKRTLAYSTISQIGYMFLALGVGAWSAAIFHFMTHAFFKALLFLAAGAIIEALHHEHDMFRMGGLRKKMPLIFWTFLAGAASLAALPLITAGFYSKDAILWYSFAGMKGGAVLWLAGLLGAFITSVYTTRMVILVFFGEAKTEIGHMPGKLMTYPLVLLAFFAVFAGFIELPHNFGHVEWMTEWLEGVLPVIEISPYVSIPEWLFQLLAAALTFLGIWLGYQAVSKRARFIEKFKSSEFGTAMRNLWFSGWGFDWFYNRVFVQPFVYLATINKNDIVDQIYTGMVNLTEFFHDQVRKTQTGSLRWYVMGIVLGAVVLLALLSIK
jgi:NADH-quinone oxidoreductase subunit L